MMGDLIPNSSFNTEVYDEGLAVFFPTGITGLPKVLCKGHQSHYITRGIMGKYAIATEIWCTLSMPAYLPLSQDFPMSYV